MSFNDDPFSMVGLDLSVGKSAECESWCKPTAKDFYLRQIAFTPSNSWNLFPLEMKEEPRKKWKLTFDHLSYARASNLQCSDL